MYERYIDSEFLPTLVAEIGWSHNLVIMERCKDDLESRFHISMTKKFGEIFSLYFGRFLIST
ncbi:MAG: DUF1016 domain-containing protein [Bacteroidia bacterium]|nr:DUF1016 domain-containing protein [Bacteroidia bacterium]